MHIVEVSKIDLYCLQNIVFHFWPKLTHPDPAAWSLYDSWTTCILCTINELFDFICFIFMRLVR